MLCFWRAVDAFGVKLSLLSGQMEGRMDRGTMDETGGQTDIPSGVVYTVQS